MGSQLEIVLARDALFAASLYAHNIKCGKPQCKCAKGSYRHHLWCVSLHEQGHSRTRVVSAAQYADVERLTGAHAGFRQARREIQFPLKKGMDVWEDAQVLADHDGRAWQRHVLPKPTRPPPPQDRPEPVARREAQRRRILQQPQNREGSPEPGRTLESIEYHFIEPSRVWESCTVPVSVLLMKNHYATGEVLDWALASTREFADPFDMWHAYGLRAAVQEDHWQAKCFWDMTHFRSTALSHVVNRIIFVELAASLIQIFLRKVGRNELAGRTRQRVLDALLPNRNKLVLYYQQRFGTFDPYEHQELLLPLRDGARRKVLGKTRRLRRAQLGPPDLPWRPE